MEFLDCVYLGLFCLFMCLNCYVFDVERVIKACVFKGFKGMCSFFIICMDLWRGVLNMDYCGLWLMKRRDMNNWVQQNETGVTRLVQILKFRFLCK
jgi:hypothetical protein